MSESRTISVKPPKWLQTGDAQSRMGRGEKRDMNIQSIIEFAGKIFTRNNITFALALLGSAGTAYTFISQRRKISLSIHYYSYKNRSLLMYVSFTNCSRLPISITNVSIVQNDICYPCVYIPAKVLDYAHRIGKGTVGYKEIMSIQFPVYLSALAGSSGYLYFDTLPDTYPDAPKEVTLEVSTSRGRAKRMKLSVPLS